MTEDTIKLYGEIASYIRGRQYTQEGVRLLKSLLQVAELAYKDNDMVAMQWLFEKIKRVPCKIRPEAGEIIGVKLKVTPIQTKKLEENYYYYEDNGVIQ